MGYGSYSYTAHKKIVSNRSTKRREEVFKQRQVHPLMDPHGVKFRESRDSADHPNSLPIIFALDVTGSMGKIPEMLAKQELPHFMEGLMSAGVPDPQIMFVAFGDAFCDNGPLQVGQLSPPRKPSTAGSPGAGWRGEEAATLVNPTTCRCTLPLGTLVPTPWSVAANGGISS